MLSDNFTPEKYLGNGTTVGFSFGWAILAEANLRVYLEETTTLVQTTQVLGTDFSIDSGWDRDGGTITFVTAPSSSYNVIITRDIASTQEVGYTTSSGFQGKIIGNSFDKLTAMVQDNAEILDRCLRYPVGTADTIPTEFVAPGATAGYPYWDGSAYDLVTAITATDDYPGDITRGTDVSKSATPAVGDIHVATDTSILYICFTAGTWTDYNQEIIDQNVLQIMNISQDNIAGAITGVTTTTDIYQSITPARDMYVTAISLSLLSGGGNIGVRIETDTADAPSGTMVSGSSEVTYGGAAGWVDVAMGQIIKLEAGTKYWVGITSKSGGYTPNFRKADADIMSGETFIDATSARSDLDLALKVTSADLAVGDCVGVVANEFEKAQADSEANSKGFIGIVEAVTSVSFYSFIDIVMSGVITGLSSLVGGDLYYLDPATAGDYTATKPIAEGQYVKPIMVALSETTGIIINQVGIEIVASTTDMVFWENSAVGYENEVVYNQ